VVEKQAMDLLRTLSLPADWRTTVLQKAEAFLKPDAGKRTLSPAAIQRQIEILALAHAEGDLSTDTFDRECERMRTRLAEAQANLPTPRQLDLSKAAELLKNFDTLVEYLSPFLILYKIVLESQEVKQPRLASSSPHQGVSRCVAA
jgi:hypothetical protein